MEDEVRAVPPLFATTILSPVNEVAFVPPLAMLNVPPERTPFDTLTAPSERPVRLMVPVAVRPATERLPESRPLPCTERSWEGELVPIPTLPEEFASNVVPETVNCVVEAYSNMEVEEAERAMGEPLNHTCVEVEFASCPKLVVGVKENNVFASEPH